MPPMDRPANPTEMLHLTGGEALPARRREHLLGLLRTRAALEPTSLQAHFHYIAVTHAPLDDAALAVLHELLDIAPAPVPQRWLSLMVTPRAGTISPWSSKATDIAHNCGLQQVLRLERAICFALEGVPPNAENLRRAAPLLHRSTGHVRHRQCR